MPKTSKKKSNSIDAGITRVLKEGKGIDKTTKPEKQIIIFNSPVYNQPQRLNPFWQRVTIPSYYMFKDETFQKPKERFNFTRLKNIGIIERPNDKSALTYRYKKKFNTIPRFQKPEYAFDVDSGKMISVGELMQKRRSGFEPLVDNNTESRALLNKKQIVEQLNDFGVPITKQEARKTDITKLYTDLREIETEKFREQKAKEKAEQQERYDSYRKQYQLSRRQEGIGEVFGHIIEPVDISSDKKRFTMEKQQPYHTQMLGKTHLGMLAPNKPGDIGKINFVLKKESDEDIDQHNKDYWAAVMAKKPISKEMGDLYGNVEGRVLIKAKVFPEERGERRIEVKSVLEPVEITVARKPKQRKEYQFVPDKKEIKRNEELVGDDYTNDKIIGYADGKPVIKLSSGIYPSVSALNNIYKKIPDDRKVPIVMESRRKYLEEYVSNQERLKHTKFTSQQKQQYMNEEMEKLKPVTARFTTYHNPWIPVRVVLFPGKKKKDILEGDIIHEFGHEVQETHPGLWKKWKHTISPKTSPTLYGTTKKDEDFAESYVYYYNKKLQPITNPKTNNEALNKRLNLFNQYNIVKDKTVNKIHYDNKSHDFNDYDVTSDVYKQNYDATELVSAKKVYDPDYNYIFMPDMSKEEDTSFQPIPEDTEQQQMERLDIDSISRSDMNLSPTIPTPISVASANTLNNPLTTDQVIAMQRILLLNDPKLKQQQKINMKITNSPHFDNSLSKIRYDTYSGNYASQFTELKTFPFDVEGSNMTNRVATPLIHHRIEASTSTPIEAGHPTTGAPMIGHPPPLGLSADDFTQGKHKQYKELNSYHMEV